MVCHILDRSWFYSCSDEIIVCSDIAVDFRFDRLAIPWSAIAPNSILRILRHSGLLWLAFQSGRRLIKAKLYVRG